MPQPEESGCHAVAAADVSPKNPGSDHRAERLVLVVGPRAVTSGQTKETYLFSCPFTQYPSASPIGTGKPQYHTFRPCSRRCCEYTPSSAFAALERGQGHSLLLGLLQKHLPLARTGGQLCWRNPRARGTAGPRRGPTRTRSSAVRSTGPVHSTRATPSPTLTIRKPKAGGKTARLFFVHAKTRSGTSSGSVPTRKPSAPPPGCPVHRGGSGVPRDGNRP